MILRKITIIFIFLTLINSCKFKAAPIENHSRDFYAKANYNNENKYKNYKKSGQRREIAKNNQVKITAGDTLYGIAQKYNVNIRDLIEENNLSAPYILMSGTFLKLPNAKYHEVQNSETLYSISRDYKMNLNELVEINNLNPPYQIYAGQKIKISKQNSQNQNTQTTVQYSKPKNNAVFKEKTLSNKENRFSWPVKGTIISEFGPKKGGLYNDGINIKTNPKQEVASCEDGVVAYVGNELKGYGNLVIIKHSGGWISAYGHLSQGTVLRGEKVKKGQKIALAGATGNVDSSQLYFGLRKGRDAVNPAFYLKN